MKDFQITFTGKKYICENTVAFFFDTKDSGYNFNAGQYAYFTVIDPEFPDEKGNSRPFSFANSPDLKNEIYIAARINSSVFINNLSLLKPGSKIFISNPAGSMNLEDDLSVPVVFIAGGIGITPARSIIENEINKKSRRKIILFYSNKTESQAAFFEDFMNWSSLHQNFRFIPLIDDIKNTGWKYEFGFINKDILTKHLSELKNKMYYLIGPDSMVESTVKILLQSGVDNKNIKKDHFS